MYQRDTFQILEEDTPLLYEYMHSLKGQMKTFSLQDLFVWGGLFVFVFVILVNAPIKEKNGLVT